jgi:hypothetical protein
LKIVKSSIAKPARHACLPLHSFEMVGTFVV